MATNKAADFSQQIKPESFQGYVQQGIIDKSKAMKTAADFQAIKTIGDIGIKAYQEYDKTQVLEGVTDQVNEIVKEQQTRSLAGIQGLEEEQTMLQSQIEGAKQQAGYNETYPIVLDTELNQEVQGIQNVLTEKADQLVRAKQQGIMTDFELQERLRKIARETIANNPAYASEIASHVDTISNINNLTARVKREEKMVQDEQATIDAMNKDILEEMETRNIDESLYTDGRGNLLDPEGAMNAINADRRLKKEAEDFNKMVQRNEKIANLNSQQFFGEGYDAQFSNGAYAYADSQLANIINSDASEAEKLTEITREVGRLKVNLNKGFPLMGLSLSDTQVKDYSDMLKGIIDDLANVYKDRASGKLDAEAAKNKLSIIKDKSQIDLYETIPNKDLLDLYADIAEKLGAKEGRGFAEKVVKGYKQILTDNPDNVGTKYEKSNSSTLFIEKNRTGELAFKPGLVIGIENAINKEEGIGPLTQQLDVINRKLNSNPANATEIIRDLNSSLASPNFKAVVDKIQDTSILGDIQQSILAYTTPLETLARNSVTDSTKVSLRSDGRVQIAGADKRTQSQTVRSINEAFLAFHHVSGLSLDDAINQFYSKIPSLGVVEPTEKK